MSSRPADLATASTPALDEAVRLDGVTRRFGTTLALDEAWLKSAAASS